MHSATHSYPVSVFPDSEVQPKKEPVSSSSHTSHSHLAHHLHDTVHTVHASFHGAHAYALHIPKKLHKAGLAAEVLAGATAVVEQASTEDSYYFL